MCLLILNCVEFFLGSADAVREVLTLMKGSAGDNDIEPGVDHLPCRKTSALQCQTSG